ncbi:hypothetical protein H5400_37295 [Rhodococcus wratislaviensis]|nr:hypothetical protein [Rhodococcus sp. 3A]MBC2897884.1 hypothetical protein [Rhodococcus sp. 4CII]
MPDPPSDWPENVYYRFVLAEGVSERVLAAFPELVARSGPADEVTLYGRVHGPPDLRELLARFDDLGLTVIEIHRTTT